LPLSVGGCLLRRGGFAGHKAYSLRFLPSALGALGQKATFALAPTAGKRRGQAGLTVMPAVVLDVSDDQVEVLRTQENLRRRGLKPSETARAIRRLYELHGITEKGGRPAKDNSETVSEFAPAKTVEDVARDAGVSPKKAQRFNRIADLTGPLMRLLDHGVITQTMAYGFAQRPATCSPPVC